MRRWVSPDSSSTSGAHRRTELAPGPSSGGACTHSTSTVRLSVLPGENRCVVPVWRRDWSAGFARRRLHPAASRLLPRWTHGRGVQEHTGIGTDVTDGGGGPHGHEHANALAWWSRGSGCSRRACCARRSRRALDALRAGRASRPERASHTGRTGGAWRACPPLDQAALAAQEAQPLQAGRGCRSPFPEACTLGSLHAGSPGRLVSDTAPRHRRSTFRRPGPDRLGDTHRGSRWRTPSLRRPRVRRTSPPPAPGRRPGRTP